MAARIRTLNFLPEIFQTPTNAQFLGATLDQVVDQPNTMRIEGYVGSKFGYGINAKDNYVIEPTKTRIDYQLDPGVVFTKTNTSTAKDFISYPGIIDALKLEGAITDNNDRLFNSQFYSWDSFTNLDKIINFNQYYWLPTGAPTVNISTDIVYTATDYNVQSLPNGYNISSDVNPAGTTNPTLTLIRGGTYTFTVNQSTEFWIQGKPGVTGYDPQQLNVQTRDVLGVENNGATAGIVIFTVPYKDAQNEYNFPGNNLVDVVSTLPFDQVNGQLVSALGGIDGVTGLEGLTVMFYNTGVVDEQGFTSKFYDTTLYDEDGGLPGYTPPGSSADFNNFEGGYYTDVSATFYTITYEGNPADPVIRLVPASSIPTNEKITANYGTEWKARNFYRNVAGTINIVPYLSAILDTLYYQDGTSPNKVGIIRLIESNTSNQLDITDILGRTQYTSPNGVVFTNGLKVSFSGNIFPSSYADGEYYVEGVGTAIELINVADLIAPEPFTEGTYTPYDSLPYDIGNYDSTLYIPVYQDYITIARNSIDKNAWSRSNRWFHIDVINATATYNNNPSIATTYATQDNKAKRPIIEFYPNLRLFNNGVIGKDPIDFFDDRTPDAFTYVAGQQEYWPDVEVYTAYTGSIASVTGTTTTVSILASDVTGTFQIGQYISDTSNVLPRNSQITNITGTTTLTLTIVWDDTTTIPATTNTSFIANDLSNDNYSLYDGARIVFSVDTNENVKNKIYVVRFSDIHGTGTPVITLTEAADGLVLPLECTFAFKGYNNQGKNFYFDGIEWLRSQEKTTVNQAPLFDVFDNDGISFGNTDVYVGTSFKGNKLFSYGIGSGIKDIVLGFPLKYSSVNNVGDISFDVPLNGATFNYVNGTTPITQKVNTGYVYNYTSGTNVVRQIGWQTAVAESRQYQIFSFDYVASNPITSYTCDIAAATNTVWPNIQVYVNNDLQPSSSYTYTIGTDSTVINFTVPEPSIDTVVEITLLSDQVSKTAYYQIPINLQNNPFNEDVTVVNVGDIRGQYQSIFYNNPDTTGDVFGSNNYRDLGNLVPWGTKIIQNSASLVLPGSFLRLQNHNLFNSLQYNSQQYINFKSLLVYTIDKTDYTIYQTPASILDDALDQITENKTNSEPFFWSDMLPSKAAYATNTYTFANSLDVSIYPLNRIYNFSTANYYGVLVYLTTTVDNYTSTIQLVINQDYTVSIDSPSLTITKDLDPGDIVTIKEYTQTFGSYVPNTPTKLGLYPSFIPEVVLDSNYSQPTYFILGHDGSYTKLYGDYVDGYLVDYRDKALLEFETRVYNNLKLSDVIPLRDYDVIPGFFRTTDYSYEEILEIYSQYFLNWVGQNRIQYKEQFYQANNQFSYNYNQSGNKINGQVIPQGFWRGIYQYFYDTSTPNLTPWEMLGFAQEPSWWTERYGAAPYTSDNLVLWGDLAAGINWNNGDPYVMPEFVRDQLLKVIPVDSAGDLLSPFDAVMGNYSQRTFRNEWRVGDVASAEFSYRRSSSWPFDLMKILALTKPAEFFNLGVDVDNYKYSTEFNQYLVNNRSHLVISDIGVYGTGTPKTSYVNWIVDYEKQAGVDATQNVTDLFNNLDVRLIYRLAGFSDKSLLGFYVEKGTPNSRNASLLIPDESYSVLLYDNVPITTIIYSGIVVQSTTNGWKVFGNSQSSAYFITATPKINGNYNKVTVGNTTVQIAKNYTDKTAIVPYGTEFVDIQSLSQFIANYGQYLLTQGVLFDQIESGIDVNWNRMITEMLYWTQSGWEVGSLVNLNPAANLITINKDSHVVQPLTLQRQNFILNQNSYPIQSTDLAVNRESTFFSARPLNEGDTVAYGQFNISNFEHGIVFDNVTLFNDILYNLVTGLRQNRILTRGTKSADWNGTVDAQGFILNQDNIEEWSPNQKYTRGSIVRYKNKYWFALKVLNAKDIFEEQYWKETDYNEIQKGLLPNSSTRSYESTLFYDTNKSNLDQDSDLLSWSLIGYRPRDYLALADLTDITQVNVYKNLIKEKGTRVAANSFKGLNLPQGGIDYDVYENWAIKTGEFGGVLNNNFVDFRLNQSQLTGNPSIVGLTNGVFTDGVQQEVPLYSIFNYGRPINTPNVLPTLPIDTPDRVFPSAGYANFNDVKISSYYYNGLNTATTPLSNLYVNEYVWLANYNSTWQVYTPTSTGQVVGAINNLNGTVTIQFATQHNLSKYQPFAIVNFNSNIDGYRIVASIVDNFRVTIALSLSASITTVTGNGVAMKFSSQRVATPSDINNLPLLDSEFVKNKVWVDENDDGSWAVYRKSLNYAYNDELLKTGSSTYGSAVAQTTNLGYLISDADAGVAYRYSYSPVFDTYSIVQTITEGASFGSTITYSDNLFVISQPTGASYTDRKVYIYDLVINTLVNELQEYQVITAPNTVTDWGSSIAMSGDQKWLYISAYEQNLVYVYRKSEIDGQYAFSETITVSGLTSGDNFGYSIATNYYGNSVVVSAPNQDNGAISDFGYAYAFDRLVQTYEAPYNSLPYVPQTFGLIFTPITTPVVVTATDSGTDRFTCASSASLVVDDPIVFTGTVFGGVSLNTVYYVLAKPTGTTFTVSTERGGSILQLTTNTGSMTSVQQTEAIFVSVNGTLIDDNEYAVVGSTMNIYASLTAGDIVTVSGSEFVLVQDFASVDANPEIGTNFGYSLDVDNYANELLIGAPFEVNNQNEEGAVYRYTNGGSSYGIIIGTVECNVTSATTILINGYPVTIPAGNAPAVANVITSANITNVTATAGIITAGNFIEGNTYTIISLGNTDFTQIGAPSNTLGLSFIATGVGLGTGTAYDNFLTIQVVNANLAYVNSKLTLSVLDADVLAELGIELYTQTQLINSPHTAGRTQFGSAIKFNEAGSFVVSAPVSARYAETTFDASDDENYDNDTLFDNNTTQFIDSFVNAGAVYMYDYLPVYNESVSKSGAYVYAQSVNALNIDYGAQPYYGTALDFNNTTAIIGTPRFRPGSDNGQVVIYTNSLGTPDWSVYRNSAPVVDVDAIQNVQLYSVSTNNTLDNLDYIDPLQGKLLGAVRENLDIVSNADPASYNSPDTTSAGNVVWGPAQVGKLWYNTSTTRFVNYHQSDDVVYNSKWWGRVFPGSDVKVYSWITSDVLPILYQGPGTPYNIDEYAVQYSLNSTGSIVPVYFYWVRNTNIVFTKTGKTLSDTICESYIASPISTGISYMSPIQPNVFGLYNCGSNINSTDTALHIGFATGTNDDVSHSVYSLIRSNYADDFLPGLPGVGDTIVPESLYNRLLESFSGVDQTGAVVPDPYLPKPVQSGILVRPRQSFFYDRFKALQNYGQYANEVLKKYPLSETSSLKFLFTEGEINKSTDPVYNTDPTSPYYSVNPWTGPIELFYNTRDYWELVNWWAVGYDDNTKAAMLVESYYDLATLNAQLGLIVTVNKNGEGLQETYIFNGTEWERIGLQNGTIQLKSSLWDYADARLGFGDNFFDTTPYDTFPSEETRYIIRALNEELPSNLLLERNKLLILMFQYIVSETIESQNYLPWLNKTSFIDVSHTIRELLPLEVFQSDNQDFLSGYLNEAKPFHVVIKDFLFKYTGTDVYDGEITDFDLPAQYNTQYEQYITPELVYSNPSGINQFLPTDPIWQTQPYINWFNNQGLSITGVDNYPITTLASYLTLNSISMAVDNVYGFPTTGVILIGDEEIAYSSVDRAYSTLSGLTRGVNGTPISNHIPGEQIIIDLPPVLLLNSGRGYSEPPKVTAYIDTSIYPEPRRAAILQPVMNLDTILRIDVVDPGDGYQVLPEIRIEPSGVITFASTDVDLLTRTITLQTQFVQTGDLVKYYVSPGTTPIGGVDDGQYYYICVLETSPFFVIALYTNYADALQDHDRVVFTSTGSGSYNNIAVSARASCVSTSAPIRENNIKLRFDRTTYNSQVTEWVPNNFYGSFYAGLFNNSTQIASSSITLESSQPPVADILASAEGATFEIQGITNDQVVAWSSLVRQVSETTTDFVRLTYSSTEPNASGSTIGFYVGMPIKFDGACGPIISNNTTYYVAEVINESDFSISETAGGSVLTLSNYTVTAAGMTCYVGEVTNTAIVTIAYPGILDVTNTEQTTNFITSPTLPTGTGGTSGFYVGLPVYFVGDVFGGLIENETYYITTIIDTERFTISKTNDPLILEATATTDLGDTVTVNSTLELSVNDPIIFTGTTFGGITAGEVYYVRSIESGTTITIADVLNGGVVSLTTGTGSCTLTSQTTALQLTTDTGTVTMNVGLPVSPGQVTGQEFTFYPSLTLADTPYIEVTGTNGNLVTRNTVAATDNGDYLYLNELIGGLTNIYNNIPFTVSETIGGLTAGDTYYVVSNGTISVEVASSSSSTNEYTLASGTLTTGFYIGMPISFSGAVFGNVVPAVTYFINSFASGGDTFTVTDTIGGSDLVLTTDNGQMTLTADNPYITLTDTLGDPAIPLSNDIREVVFEQSPTSIPSFNVGNMLGGYIIQISQVNAGSFVVGNTYTIVSVGNTNFTLIGAASNTVGLVFTATGIGSGTGVAAATGSGYTFDNTVTISGADLGGTSPLNDLVMTVSAIGVITPNANPSYDFLLPIESDGNITGMIGSGTPAGIVNQFYLKVISATQCEVYYDALMTIPVNGITLASEYTLGDYAFLPEPFWFDQSIVRYNNQVWQCVISNNDNEFILGKWELLDSGSRKLNELDRIVGYYKPSRSNTDAWNQYLNMPGSDLTQLIKGITYPNGTYLGNAFAPEDQYTLDTILADQPFYTTNVNTVAIVWDGTTYVGAMNTPEYTASVLSENGNTWVINKIVDIPVNVTDIAYSNSKYVLSFNDATNPIYTSNDGITYAVANVDSQSLSSVAYGANVWVGVGENIVTSTDTSDWSQTDLFLNGLTNNLNSVAYANMTSYVGFIAVGAGQEYVGIDVQNVGLIKLSTNGYIWTNVPTVTYKGFNGVTSSGTQLIAVGEDGVIYTSLNGTNWTGVNETNILSVNPSTNVINVGSTTGFQIGDTVKFTESFNVIVAGTSYTISDIVSATQVELTSVTLNGINPSNTTYMYYSPVGDTLNDVLYANSMFMAVGDNGTVRTSTDGYTWIDQTTDVAENLNGLTYNIDNNEWIVVGDDNTIIISTDDGVTWTTTSVFVTDPTVYNVAGDPFAYGYGPEELVPGVVTDNLAMIVTTRPGTDWDAQIYAHVGFNVVSTEITPSLGQLEFSFSLIVENPANMALFDITSSTNLSTRIYDYSVDWVNKTITLDTALAAQHVLRLDLYEVGNGDQLVKSNSQVIPFVDNITTGFVEMPLNCNYSANRFNGSGVIRLNSDPKQVTAIETDELDNGIVCTDVDNFTINSAITFQGDVFGGIETGTTYYVKTVSRITNKITISTTLPAGIAGPTFPVTSDTGTMIVNIRAENGDVWTDPIVIHNGTNLILGEQGIVSETQSGTNTVIVNTTDNYVVGNKIIFSNAIEIGTFIGCGITAQLTYYITSIDTVNSAITISSSIGGSDVVLANAVGIALCVTNDYAITIADQGITAKLVYSSQYNQNDDFVVLSIFGETAPTQYGYTVPEVEVFNLTNTGTEFTLTNYVSGDNPDNAIVEYDGKRLVNNSDYTIDAGTNTLNLTFTPEEGKTVAVTSYNLTDRQYLITTFGGTFSGSQTVSVTAITSTHSVGTYDEDSPNTYTYDEDTPDIVPFDMVLNYLTLDVGEDTNVLNVNDAIRFTSPTIGGIVAGQVYYVVEISNSSDFAVSETLGGEAFTLTNDTGSMLGIANPPTVANITEINNNISVPTASTNVDTTTYPNTITGISTSGFQVDQPIVFKNISGTTGVGGISTDGTIYYVSNVINSTDFEVSDTVGGASITVTTDSGSMIAYVGGNPAVTVTTGIPHNLQSGDIVRIDGVTGSTELNNNIYYARVITDTTIGLYYSEYDPVITAENDPVTQVSSYTGGGYIWLDKTFTLVTTIVSETAITTNLITSESTASLVLDTPIIFTGTMFGGIQSTVTSGDFIVGNTYRIIETANTDWTSIGALSSNPGTEFVATGIGTGSGTATAIYYIRSIESGTEFTISGAQYGDVFELTSATGLVNLTQWEQNNVDRLWVTVNGYRVPSSGLYLNPQNNLSILTVIQPGDVVIITSMMPSATPNQLTYVQTVNKSGTQTIFRANSLTRTWLNYGLQNVDDVIYLEDVSRVTETIIQNETAPTIVDNTMSIGLEGNRNSISQVIVYNNTTGLTIDPAEYSIVIRNVAPTLVIDIDPLNPAITVGDSLTVTVILGNLIYVNGEQIRFTTVDFVANTLSGLQRGTNGTGEQVYIPKYTEVYSILASNILPEIYNGFTWNSYNYNLVEGDPLQISETYPATFLNQDVP
jgi:hypothetical protein